MASYCINKTTLLGYIGQLPELRTTNSGQAAITLSVATSDSWRDKQTGETKERTEWHRVVIYGKLAEAASEYVKVGTQVYIEGQSRTRQWADQGGMIKYVTEIVVGPDGKFILLGKSDKTSTQPANTPSASAIPPAPDEDDNIPF
ncbi:TPA: single-stranded DNA-binding protein [Salmonella enterica subsp. salamae serovar 35:g,m,s,t:-]|nr:single-stranded DNA-binding protein [Salmonella enterica subsp. salamae serovar 35:g,m,s,t:-]HCA3549707.1 single-stranded DNA-binding protein [Salmonella enterica subsp. salamae serovar 35:g,m,s,t:-]